MRTLNSPSTTKEQHKAQPEDAELFRRKALFHSTVPKVEQAKQAVLTEQDENYTSSSGSDADSGDETVSLAEFAKRIKQEEGTNIEHVQAAKATTTGHIETPSLTSDKDDDSDGSDDSHVTTASFQTQLKNLTPSSPAKSKLKEAVASHKQSNRSTNKVRGDNVLNAHSLQSTPVVSDSNAVPLPQSAPALTVQDIRAGAPFQTSDPWSKVSARKDKAEQQNAKKKDQDDISRLTQDSSQPVDAVPVPIPTQRRDPPPNSTQITPEEEKAAIGRIANQWGAKVVEKPLTINSFRYSTTCFADSSDDEPSPGDKGEAGKSGRKAKGKTKESTASVAKRQKKSKASSSPQQGTVDDLLAVAQSEYNRCEEHKKRSKEKTDKLMVVWEAKEAAKKAAAGGISEDAQSPSKKRKRDEHDPSVIKEPEIIGEESKDPDEKAANPRYHIPATVLEQLKSLIPATQLSSTTASLITAESDRIDNLITRNQRREAKQLAKGKITNAIWQDIDAAMAIENGLIEETKYDESDAIVIFTAATELIKKVTAESVAKGLKEGTVKDTSGRRDASNLSEVELQSYMRIMAKNREIETLKAEVKRLKESEK